MFQEIVRRVGQWPSLSAFSLDVRLAGRMLVKYPLLTIVGGAGMAFGIAVGVGAFEIRSQFINPTLPLDDGSRIVGLRNWDVRRNGPGPVNAGDFTAWLEQIRGLEELGAAALVERNLTVDGSVEPISVAEMTASGFRLARVPALAGRTLVDADESPGAAPVVVIGHSLWQRRFLGDPRAVGRSVRLGTEQRTIVGVMPDGFGFPVAHQVWIPLPRARSTALDAPALLIFGRLAKGVGLGEAQAELTTIGRRAAIDAPETHESLRPEVVPYAHLIRDPRDFGVALTLANVFLIMLIVVVCANVALLMFARAATRENEIGVRNALGASRGRIVAQLFVEALALSGLSVVAGLVTARYALGSLLRTLEADSGRALPFWMSDRLAPSTIVYGVVLMMLGAAIIGVFPALKMTGDGLHARLRHFTAGGGGYRFGGVWTFVIAAQVSVTVLFPATAFLFHRGVVLEQTRHVGFPAEEYLSARLVIDPANLAGTAGETMTARTEATVEELRRRLLAEPGVTTVAVANRLPGTVHPGGRFEIEGDDAPPRSGYQVRIASVDAGFFDALGARPLSGRVFAPTDVARHRDVALVNTSFVERVLRGGNPIGRRIRAVAGDAEQPPGPWIEIVGLVPDLGIVGAEDVGVYRPLSSASSDVHVAVHVRGAPMSLAGRLRALASEVEPTLRVYDVMPLDQAGADEWTESLYLSRLLAAFSALALLLSLTAIYAVMSFTVLQRTREIGVRLALGANRWRTIVATVRGPLLQVVFGVGAGAILVALASVGLSESALTPVEAGIIASYAVLMLVVCLLACVVPTSRALRLQPSEVLRADG